MPVWALFREGNYIILHMSLNDFEIIRKLGEGAFSIVYKVHRKSDGQAYALKKVKLSGLNFKEKENALNEIRIMASFSNPNIIAYKEAFIDESSNTICIVMELAEGGDLMKKITDHQKNNSSFPELEIWTTLIQITNGLRGLHNGSIIHRDLKCANIFISKDGTIKLGDLNVSIVNKKGLAYTQTGTPYYASPEVWKDKPYTYSSDIWSLGCVIYEMAALTPPFNASGMKGLCMKILKGEYPNIPSIYSENLSTMIRQLLQVNPTFRPNCTQILQSPLIQKYWNLSPVPHPDQLNLLSTIKFEPSLKKLKGKLPLPNYEENRGRSASNHIVNSASNRELSARPGEYYRNYSLNTRGTPNVPIQKQVSLEVLDRNYRGKNLIRNDVNVQEILEGYKGYKTPGLPSEYLKNEPTPIRKIPLPRPRPINKVGMMIMESPRPRNKLTPIVQSPTSKQIQEYRELNMQNMPLNPIWLS